MNINIAEIAKKLNKIIKKLYQYIKRIDINISVAVASLFISYKACEISQNTLDHADTQFKQNSKSSDSLFNVQLNHSRELNNSLIKQIKDLQDITQKQLTITNEQLVISKETLNEQIYSSRPKIIEVSSSLLDTSNVFGDIYSPKTSTIFKNNGQRFALKFIVRAFVIYNDFKEVRNGLTGKQSSIIETNGEKEFNFLPRIPVQFRYNFYYVYDISYYDDALKRTFTQSYFNHYAKIRNSYLFNDCILSEKMKLVKVVNEVLNEANELPMSVE